MDVRDPDRHAGEPLDPEQHRALTKGIAEFNAGRFFECHETLEEIWLGAHGPERTFVQGILQVAVGLHHLRNGNRIGAASQLRRGLEKLRTYPDGYADIELAEFIGQAETTLGLIERGGILSPAEHRLPAIRIRGV